MNVFKVSSFPSVFNLLRLDTLLPRLNRDCYLCQLVSRVSQLSSPNPQICERLVEKALSSTRIVAKEQSALVSVRKGVRNAFDVEIATASLVICYNTLVSQSANMRHTTESGLKNIL